MADTLPNPIKAIGAMYQKNKGFLNQYGGSVFMAITILLIATGLIVYFYVLSHLKSIRSKWSTVRCDPQYMAFAGIIHPEEGKTNLETTSDNFVQCSNAILSEIASYETMPLYYATSATQSMFDSLTGALNVAREDYASIRNAFGKVFGELYEKIESILVPIRFMFLKQRSILKKTEGVFVTVLYSVLSGYMSLRSFIKGFLDIVILALVVFTAIIVILFAMVFSIPAAIAALVVFVAVVGAVTPVIIWAEVLLAITSPKLPNKPNCFSPKTPIDVSRKRGRTLRDILLGKRAEYTPMKPTRIPIERVRLGERLVVRTPEHTPDGVDTVCAIMRLCGKKTRMVSINGIEVSAFHPVQWNARGFLRPRMGVQSHTSSTPATPVTTSTQCPFREGEWYLAQEIAEYLFETDTTPHATKTSKSAMYVDQAKYTKHVKQTKGYKAKPCSELICLSTLHKHFQLPVTSHPGHTITVADWDELDETDLAKLVKWVNTYIMANRTVMSSQCANPLIDTHTLDEGNGASTVSQLHKDATTASTNLVDSVDSVRYISSVVPHPIHMVTRYNLSWIHRELESGFHGDSRVLTSLHPRKYKRISSLDIGDSVVIQLPQQVPLKDSSTHVTESTNTTPNTTTTQDTLWRMSTIHDTVIGVVEVDTSGTEVYQYEWIDSRSTSVPKRYCWVGGPNCMRYVKMNEQMDTMVPDYPDRYDTTLVWTTGKERIVSSERPKKLYHVITASGLVTVNGIVMYDYNGMLDNLLGHTFLYVPEGT